MDEASDIWRQTQLALSLLAIDPSGLGGIWLRARSGVVRDRFVGSLAPALAPLDLRRIYPGINDDQLFGGLDLAATLDQGKLINSAGVFSGEGAAVVLSMAERATSDLIARTAQMLDRNAGHCIIALDEGAEDEALASALQDRLALHLDFSDLSHRDAAEITLDLDRIEIARSAVSKVQMHPEQIDQIMRLCAAFGVAGLRAPQFTLRAARAIAALSREKEVQETHLRQAVTLVLGPRATQVPETMEPPEESPQEQMPEPGEAQESGSHAVPEEILAEAIKANLPKGLLDGLVAAKAHRQAKGGAGAGTPKTGNRRGRPKPPQRGARGGANRIDLVATLRAAAPWQKMRRDAPFAPKRQVHIRGADLRYKKFEEKSDRLLIFAVDASGSAALARLAEAKGAVELLLAEAYARRDHVALIAFRGASADLLLPPTRSLVQTKRRLSALPGGGGTPLAMGLEAALTLAMTSQSKGLTPTIALLTDGKANVALDGSHDRPLAAENARTVARLIRANETPAVVIDTGNRPQAALKSLASDLDAAYLPLPRADAQSVSSAIEAALQ